MWRLALHACDARARQRLTPFRDDGLAEGAGPTSHVVISRLTLRLRCLHLRLCAEGLSEEHVGGTCFVNHVCDQERKHESATASLVVVLL